jgi:hypothetical protein
MSTATTSETERELTYLRVAASSRSALAMFAMQEGQPHRFIARLWRSAANFWCKALKLKGLDDETRRDVTRHFMRANHFANQAAHRARMEKLSGLLRSTPGGPELLAFARCVDDTVGVGLRHRLRPFLDFPISRNK